MNIPPISIQAEHIFTLGGVNVTNSMLMGLLVSIFLIVFLTSLVSRKKEVPGRMQGLIESVFEGAMSLIDGIMQNMDHTKKALPLILTIFFFVLFSNWAGLIPGVGSIGVEGIHNGHATIIPFLRSTSADLNFTIALSLISVFVIQIVGIITLGFKNYAGKFFVSPFHKPYGIGSIVGILELVSELSKILSFSFRLFGNVFAGEVLLVVMLHLVPVFLPIPFYAFEVFVGFIQAIVFAMLTTVFMKIAMTEGSH